MAIKGETITNKITGEKITWIETSKDTNGASLKMHFNVAPKGKAPVKHIHPEQDEIFEEVISGTLRVERNGETQILKPGDSIKVEKGLPHQWWNHSESEPMEMKVTMKPALNSEIFFEQLFGLANDNKTRKDGSPRFMQMMAMINKYKIYLAGPPVRLQKMMSYLFGGIAQLMGYKSYYKKYSP